MVYYTCLRKNLSRLFMDGISLDGLYHSHHVLFQKSSGKMKNQENLF